MARLRDAHNMLLIDIVTAALTATSEPARQQRVGMDPCARRGIRLASFDAPAGPGTSPQPSLRHPCLNELRSRTFGILGMGTVGLAIAREAFAAARANIVYHHTEIVPEVEEGCSARAACLSTVLDA